MVLVRSRNTLVPPVTRPPGPALPAWARPARLGPARLARPPGHPG